MPEGWNFDEARKIFQNPEVLDTTNVEVLREVSFLLTLDLFVYLPIYYSLFIF